MVFEAKKIFLEFFSILIAFLDKIFKMLIALFIKYYLLLMQRVCNTHFILNYIETSLAKKL